MKQLIPMDALGVFADTNDTARVNSLFVAKFFEKDHKNVLRDIKELDCSDEFRRLNFEQSSYKNDQGKKQPCVDMTRDGFTFLAMGYRGKKAAKFKELYIKRFNEMEKFIKTLVTARKEFPLLTENIKLIHDNPKPYHFSNEYFAFDCNRLLEINFQNARCREDTNLNKYVDKKRSAGKVDMVVALINAVFLAQLEMLDRDRDFVVQY